MTGSPVGYRHRHVERRRRPWLWDPYLNGHFAAPWEAWEDTAACASSAIWIFVIVLVAFLIVCGGPRY
jgi:hypothetical protein